MPGLIDATDAVCMRNLGCAVPQRQCPCRLPYLEARVEHFQPGPQLQVLVCPLVQRLCRKRAVTGRCQGSGRAARGQWKLRNRSVLWKQQTQQQGSGRAAARTPCSLRPLPSPPPTPPGPLALAPCPALSPARSNHLKAIRCCPEEGRLIQYCTQQVDTGAL